MRRNNFDMQLRPLVTLLFWFGLSFVASAKDVAVKTDANVPVEISFTSSRNYSDPFNEVTLNVLFRDPKGNRTSRSCFLGWNKSLESSLRVADCGRTHFPQRMFSCARQRTSRRESAKLRSNPTSGKNPLFKHGPIQVAADKRHLQHADGTPFFWLGDTWWMGLSHRLHFPDEFKQLAADRKEKGFNVIQIVAGLNPDSFPFDPRSANEAGLPWETNFTRIRPEYFNAADQRIRYLDRRRFHAVHRRRVGLFSCR